MISSINSVVSVINNTGFKSKKNIHNRFIKCGDVEKIVFKVVGFSKE